jgi:transcriptional repressor NF-X1
MGVVLACDDECRRLERNRKLALALEIDPETHNDPHIPYSKETLSLFQDSPKWCQMHERLLRVFAADETEKRLRFKPMPASQRAFLHALADDFGFDSESMDPEPHRHVVLLKTPRFVMAPMKTLGQCVDVRPAGGSTSTSKTLHPSASAAGNLSAAPFNALLLSGPRFGLEVADIHTAFLPHFAAVAPTIPFARQTIAFLPSDEVVIRPSSSVTAPSPAEERILETHLRSLKPAILKAHASSRPPLASFVQLCRADASLNILRREGDDGSDAAMGAAGEIGGGGWSQVAAKAAVRGARAPEKSALGSGGGFTVLGRTAAEKQQKATKEKKKKKRREEEEVVVEDWMEAEEEAELRERDSAVEGMSSETTTKEEKKEETDSEAERKKEEEKVDERVPSLGLGHRDVG